MMKTLCILGATGSIGGSTLDVVERHPDRYRVGALTAHKSFDALLELSLKYTPDVAVLSGLTPSDDLVKRWKQSGLKTELIFGPQGLISAVDTSTVIMAAIVGAAGLPPTLHAVSQGKTVLLANKEALVMTGALFMRLAQRSGAIVLPVDSEHNAVFQCFGQTSHQTAAPKVVQRITLTASGGPFLRRSIASLSSVTPDEACAHPNWVMGRKISVDSATMMNKGLELIEAKWLFDLAPSHLKVLIHPQSIVHAMVEFCDGSVLAQLSNPDMRVPIAHALAFPERIATGVKSLDLASVGSLQFEVPDRARFPCLDLAYRVLGDSGTLAAILNAANEVAVEAFLAQQIAYLQIAEVIQATLDAVPAGSAASLEMVLAADAQARAKAAAHVAALGA